MTALPSERPRGKLSAIFALLVRWRAPRSPRAGVPALRRADAHPDAPARRPIRASEDLGPPLPTIALARDSAAGLVERALPVDLDVPMAAFDPAALLAMPRQPVRAVSALARPTPVGRGEPPETSPSIATLLDRLERSRPRRQPEPRPAPQGLDETLGMLRRLATG